MILYEVNLSINPEIESHYREWLKNHIKEILKIKGFLNAEIYEPLKNSLLPAPPPSPQKIEIIIHYYLDSEKSLENYLTHYAQKFREDGVKKFKDQFTATRRILSISTITL